MDTPPPADPRIATPPAERASGAAEPAHDSRQTRTPEAETGNRRRILRRLRELAIVALLVAGSVLAGDLAVRLLPAITTASYWTQDLRVALMSRPQPQHPDIVIAAVTEETLATLPYRSPLDRDLLAGLIEHLQQAGVRAIGLDILLDQPTEPAKDDRLRRVLDEAQIPIVVGWATTKDQLTDRQAAFLESYVNEGQRGLVNLMTDPRLGTVRWIYPGREENGVKVPGFAGALADALGVAPPSEPVTLAYRAPPDAETPAFRTFPSHTIRFLPKQWLQGKVVLVGADLPQSDRHRTPWAAVLGAQAGAEAGVAVHAQALAQLLDPHSPPRLGLAGAWTTLTVASLFGLLLASFTLSVGLQVASAVAGMAVLWAAGFGLYAAAGMMVPLIAMSISFALAWAAGNAHWRGTAWRQREFIRQAFSQFTAPAVVDRLIADPSLLRLGGEKREITSLFTDVAGFTSWFERSDPQEALAILREYLSGMSQVAFDHGGTLDKIIGDALHVLFGAPVDQPDQAARAVRCALAMDAFSRAFAKLQQARGVHFGKTRIGVHSGPAVVGNFGGSRFFHYTAYGDTVNTAARLEGANKALGGSVCVSGATACQCPELQFRPIGALLVVGKQVPIDAFEPLPTDNPAAELSRSANYLEAFAMMRDDDPGSLRAFQHLAASFPDDWLYALHAGRLARGETGTLLVLKEK